MKRSLFIPPDKYGPTLLGTVSVWCRVAGMAEDGPFPLTDLLRLDRRGRLPAGLEARARRGPWLPWPEVRRRLADRQPLTRP